MENNLQKKIFFVGRLLRIFYFLFRFKLKSLLSKQKIEHFSQWNQIVWTCSLKPLLPIVEEEKNKKKLKLKLNIIKFTKYLSYNIAALPYYI